MSSQPKNIAGQRFGHLTAVRPDGKSEKHGDVCWMCICDCGKEKTIRSGNLVSGNSKSCGCSRLGLGRINLAGERFGRLTVLRKALNNQAGIRWMCRCDCGAEKIISRNDLRGGRARSCGCWRRERCKEIGGSNRGTGSPVCFVCGTARSCRQGKKRLQWKCAPCQKKRSAVALAELPDHVLRSWIRQTTGLKSVPIPQNLIEAKRLHILLTRAIKERTLK